MNIRISLSTESISEAINRLTEVKDNLEWGMSETIDILTKEGAILAQALDGRMATVTTDRPDNETGRIIAGGTAPIIAEFGAGYSTMEYHPFAKNAPVPIEVGSYSRENGGMFFQTDSANPGQGYWEFGGVRYDRVQPRHGLLNANDYITENAVRIAKEVIKL